MADKTVEEYLALPYTIEVQRDESDGEVGYVARVVELPGCITQGDDFDELGEMIEDAMRGWIELAIEDGRTVPVPKPADEYSGRFVTRISRSLHRDIARAAERDGVSLNAYVATALARSVGAENLVSV